MREDSQDVKEMYEKFMGSPVDGETPGDQRTKSIKNKGSNGTSSLL